ncbi:glutathione s-transferase [Phlyctema vagabunda]|uniref:Glutathione s-transferase n=1 Tax=Phlyctema vagabunda TaxID=108571 RepID=A0ABR4PX54_9HELO
MASPPSKRQKSTKDASVENENGAPYELIYWPGMPGRGEHVRLLFEEAGVPYSDAAKSDDAIPLVTTQISASNLGDAENPPPLAPPILKHGNLTLSQTSNILLYLGERFDLAGGLPDGKWRVNSLALTALDGLSNEAHDTHHPIASSLYYEDQKDEALRKAKDYRETRLPKFLAYFQRVLHGEASKGGEWLYGGTFTYADLVLFQCLDGLKFAFPKALQRLEKGGEYDTVFKLYDSVKSRPKIKAYLESERRVEYSQGIYRHYPELDDE